MKEEKTFAGLFLSEEDTLRKIEQLRAEGVADSSMLVIANDQDELRMLKGQTDAELRTDAENGFDRFQDFLAGDKPIRQALRQKGMAGEDIDYYCGQIHNGAIMLFTDERGVVTDSGANIDLTTGIGGAGAEAAASGGCFCACRTECRTPD